MIPALTFLATCALLVAFFATAGRIIAALLRLADRYLPDEPQDADGRSIDLGGAADLIHADAIRMMEQRNHG